MSSRIICLSLAMATFTLTAADATEPFLSSQFLGSPVSEIVPGQQVTTPQGSPWNNFRFGWLTSSTQSTAFGNLYIMDRVYAGEPSSLSIGTPGVHAVVPKDANGLECPHPSFVMQPLTSYFFYTDELPTGGIIQGGNDPYPGGISCEGLSPFTPNSGADWGFVLVGSVVPEPSTFAMLAVLGAWMMVYASMVYASSPTGAEDHDSIAQVYGSMSNVLHFGAVGDGAIDDTRAIRHAVEAGDGMLRFPRGTYRITETIEIDLERSGPRAIDGTGGTARVIMAGAGPAFRLAGTHAGTGDPSSLSGNVMADQRMPTIANIVIEGEQPESDGIELIKTMQLVIQGVLVRHCRHGIHLVQRNRNVLITDSHLYFNTGAGIYLDQVNLHQINISGSHISYNRLGGIRIEGSEVRNLQITGNDIEYNNQVEHKTDPEPTAEIYVDCSQAGASVNEITIASNTIQATPSPGGSNIRIIDAAGGQDHEPRLWAINGNIIGSQQNNMHLTRCHGMTISGNCIYSCAERNLLIEDSHHMAISGNVFRRHMPAMGTGLRLVGCHDIALSGCSIHDEHAEGQQSGASLLELVDCQRINVSGCQLTDGAPYGVDATNCSAVLLTGCSIHDTRDEPKSRCAIRFAGTGQGNLIAASSIGSGVEGQVSIEESAGVRFDGQDAC